LPSSLNRIFAGLRERRSLIGPVTPRRLALIFGCQGSGTTLLQRALDAHPRMVSLGEPHSYLYLRSGRARDRRAERAPLLNLEVPQVGHDPGSARIAALLDGGACGVYLFRDPRAIAASLSRLQHAGEQEGQVNVRPEVEVAALSRECGEEVPGDYPLWSPWRRCLHHINLKHWFYCTYLADRVLPVCYERLGQDPEPELRRLARHLGADFEPALLRRHTRREGRAARRTRRDDPNDARSPTAWRRRLTAGEVRDVETVCAEPLAFWEKGYRSRDLELHLWLAS